MDIIFNLVIFTTVFCFLCCLQYRKYPSQVSQAETISKEYFPEPEDSTVSPPSLLVERRCNQTVPINNETIIIPPKPQKFSSLLPPIPQNATLQMLKNYVRTHQLQGVITERLGKKSSCWRKIELQSELLNLLAS